MVRRRLCFCGFTKWKIRKQTVTSRVNGARCVFWCTQKLRWKADDWKCILHLQTKLG